MSKTRSVDWESFVGQDEVAKAIKIAIAAAKERAETLEHVLLYGPPGLGKTSLAHIVAAEMGGSLKTLSGPSLTRVGDLASILTDLEKGDVLFIDEIHRLSRVVEEALYSSMEDFVLDIILGKGPAARPLRLELESFTIVGATTKIGMLSKPLRDRFGLVHRLKFYDRKTLAQIVRAAASGRGIEIGEAAAHEIALRSRGTPRIALKLLRRVIDYCLVEHKRQPDEALTKKSLDFYQVDEQGLDETDRKLLEAIAIRHKGGPVGLETLASLIAEDVQTIEEVYEPFLLQAGFLERTRQGRMATAKTYSHLGLKSRLK